MPTLTRLVMILAACAGLAYGAAWALAAYVTPRQAEIVIDVALPPAKP